MTSRSEPRPEAEIEFAFGAGFRAAVKRFGEVGYVAMGWDLDEEWQQYKKYRFGTSRFDWRLNCE